jgi:putative sigma-54 modulation protein
MILQRALENFADALDFRIALFKKEKGSSDGSECGMKISIYGKQMNVRESLEVLIERKLEKFNKFFGDETEAFVTCRVRKGVKIIEITVNYGATVFRSEQESDTFITALDRAVEGLERQIRKNKTRLEKKMKSGAFVIDAEDDDEYEEEAEFEIRVKSFPFKPMTPEEAILQMNLLGHSFYAFIDAETSETCVVYRRKEGSYGLIIPEKT